MVRLGLEKAIFDLKTMWKLWVRALPNGAQGIELAELRPDVLSWISDHAWDEWDWCNFGHPFRSLKQDINCHLLLGQWKLCRSWMRVPRLYAQDFLNCQTNCSMLSVRWLLASCPLNKREGQPRGRIPPQSYELRELTARERMLNSSPRATKIQQLQMNSLSLLDGVKTPCVQYRAKLGSQRSRRQAVYAFQHHSPGREDFR